MFEEFISQLRGFSLSVDFIETSKARDVIRTINQFVATKLDAYIVDLLWKTEARDNVILEPFASTTQSARGEAQKLVINLEAARVQPDMTGGIWQIAYSYRKPILVKKINPDGTFDIPSSQDSQLQGLQKVDVFRDTEGIVVLPIHYRNMVWGVYSIESERPMELDEVTINQLQEIASLIGSIVWKSDVLVQNCKDTEQAVRQFEQQTDALRESVGLYPSPTCFMIRPFEEKYAAVERALAGGFERAGFRLIHYEHAPGDSIVISGIIKEIARCHCGVADVSENNSNVMLELGMLMAEGKNFLLLKKKGADTDSLPFDLTAYNHYEYVERNGRLFYVNPANQDSEPLDPKIIEFCRNSVEQPG
jgi:hypothetical protein